VDTVGDRGALKLPRHLSPITAGSGPETAADKVTPQAAAKPDGFPDDDPNMVALWDQMVPLLDRAGLMTAADGPAVELALRHFLAARRASDAMMELDIAVEDQRNGGSRKNPAGVEFRAQSEMFLQYVKQLGMSFASRARIPAQKDAQGDNGNPFASQTG